MTTTGTLTVNNAGTSAVSIQNGSGTGIMQFDTSNSRLGVVPGGNLDTTLEVGGTASISGAVTLATTLAVTGTTTLTGKASFVNASGSDRFELTSSTARLGINAGGNTDTALEVGGTASASTVAGATNVLAGTTTASGSSIYTGEFSTVAATTSINFGGTSTTQGTCLQFKLTSTGGPVYLRVVASANTAFGGTYALRLSTKSCAVTH